MPDTPPPPPPPASDDEVEVILDQVYASPGGSPLLADLYLPRSTPKLPPAVLFLHGGGFRIGDRRLAPDLKRFFAREGIAMISIDYRLSGQSVFPAAIEDLKSAIRWARANGGRYGFDGERIGLWGSSAGGNLASLAATSGTGVFEDVTTDPVSSTVQAVVDGYGPVDFLQEDAERDPAIKASDDPESLALPPNKHSADPDSLESLYLGTQLGKDRLGAAATNPITYAKPGLPPFLIMHGLSDAMIPSAQSELLYDALVPNRTDVTLMMIEGLGHGFFDRSDLDDGGPRVMHVRRAANGAATEETVEHRRVFATVLDFFRTHLQVS